MLGVAPDNIFNSELRAQVWADVRQKLTEQHIFDSGSGVNPGVADIIETVTRPQRTLEGRWWRGEHKQMVRFAICRRGEQHVIAARCDDKIVFQRIVASVGLAAMIEAVIDVAAPAAIQSVTGPIDGLAAAAGPTDLTRYGCDAQSASTLLAATRQQLGWVHLVATETLPGGTVDRPAPAAGILDSPVGRVVSLPKIVGSQLHATFMAGSRDNLTRVVDELISFLPSGVWDNNSVEVL